MSTATETLHLTSAAGHSPRTDLYAPIHKALRSMMMDTLWRVGRADAFDHDEMDATHSQLSALLSICTAHLSHENEFVHPAIDARLPAGSRRTADDHVEHLQSIEALRAEAQAWFDAAPAERMPLGLRLYRHLALFVAENFQHMHIEETANNAALWAHYSDAELEQIHGRILAHIAPPRMLETLRWMVPALAPVERAGMLVEMRHSMPTHIFQGVLDIVRPHVGEDGWAKLERDLAIGRQEPAQ
jgi:hypothetical protein